MTEPQMLYCHMQIHAHIYAGYIPTQRITTSEVFFRNLCTSHFICKVCLRGSWWPNRTAIYWPPLLWPSALCLSRSPGLLNRRPRGPALCWMMAFFTASYRQLLWTPTQPGGCKGPFGLAWLSLPHLVSLQLIPDFLSWPSYIIVQHPLNCPLNPWNGMFDRHQQNKNNQKNNCMDISSDKQATSHTRKRGHSWERETLKRNRSISSIFPLCMKSNTLEKSTNRSVVSRFFCTNSDSDMIRPGIEP